MAPDIGRIKQTLMEVRLGDAARKMHGCRGRMKTSNDVVLSSSEHNHAPDPAKSEAAKVVSDIRKRELEGVEKPRQIIQQARTGITLEVAPHISAYKASQCTIERQRKRKQLPYHNPQNVGEIRGDLAPLILRHP